MAQLRRQGGTCAKRCNPRGYPAIHHHLRLGNKLRFRPCIGLLLADGRPLSLGVAVTAQAVRLTARAFSQIIILQRAIFALDIIEGAQYFGNPLIAR